MTGQNRTKPDTLSPRRAAFVAALLTGAENKQAAAEVGVSDRTGRRWLALPGVKTALSSGVDQELSVAMRLTVGAMKMAIPALLAILKNSEATPAARVSAARAILEAGPRLHEATDLAERVAAVEEKLTRLEGKK